MLNAHTAFFPIPVRSPRPRIPSSPSAGVDGFLPPRHPAQGVREYERKQLLERINREGATVGADIPETVEVQGETVDLHEFVFEIQRRDRVPPGEQERVDRAKRNLRRERLQRKQRLENEDLTREAGERLADSIVGIDRALHALENLGPTDLEAEAERQEAVDQQRWVKFLRQALGHQDSDDRRRHP